MSDSAKSKVVMTFLCLEMDYRSDLGFRKICGVLVSQIPSDCHPLGSVTTLFILLCSVVVVLHSKMSRRVQNAFLGTGHCGGHFCIPKS